MTQPKVELLCPAGDPQKLRIAIEYGADAVYGGVSHFSLRLRAGKEFTLETFKQEVDYAHERGKKVYATVNGFPFNSQLSLLSRHIEQMNEIGVDALIVSTPGVVRLSQKVAKNLPLHLSTQANVLNYMDAEAFFDMGVSRIIAARECSLKDLEGIKKHLPSLELEVFVHGSMCFAYSGRCLVSSLQMGRVANRGSCANDCRMPYEVFVENPEHKTLMRLEEIPGEGTYLFNAKDLNLCAHLPEILSSGVIDSVKIEGRTKSPFYAGMTTKIYRQAIDNYYDGTFEASKYDKQLDLLKNRGYTDGYLVHRPFEKNSDQNLLTAQSEGEAQVCAFVLEDETHFMCKDKIEPLDELLIIAPGSSCIECCDNEIGSIFKVSDGLNIRFKKIVTANGSELGSVHSGNTNPIKLPCRVPKYSFFIKEENRL